MHIIYSILLAIFFYLAVIISYKIMGKREISELSIFDFVMNLIIADVVATGIVEEEFWLDSLTGLIALVALQILMARIQIKHPKMRKYMNGESSMLINDGNIDYEELTKLRMQLDELIMLLRQANVPDIDDIQYAIMEANGRLSIYEKRLPTKTFPLPFIISGELKPFAIENAGRTMDWFYDQLAKNGIQINSTIKLMLYSKTHLIMHTKTDVRKIKIY